MAGCVSNTDPGGGGEVEVRGTRGSREGEAGSGGGVQHETENYGRDGKGS